jgi:hypothetical protein
MEDELTLESRDRLSPVWDMSQERVLALTILNQRFHFLLVFFSVIIGAAANTRQPRNATIVLCVGSVIAWLLAIAIVLAQRRLHAISSVLAQDKSHPYIIVTQLSGQRRSIQKILSYVIAPLCALVLTVGAVLSFVGSPLFL